MSGGLVGDSACQQAVDGKVIEELVVSGAMAGEEEEQGAHNEHQ